MQSEEIVIVGAGIIGSYCALQLARSGDPRRITLIDRNAFDYTNTSCVNMGGFATSEVFPLARPYNIWRALKWLPDPQAPLAIRLSYLPQLIPWLRVFLRSALSRKHFAYVVKSQQALMNRAIEAHKDGLEASVFDAQVCKNGAICLYKSEKRMLADWEGRWKQYRQQGLSCSRLTPAQLRRRLPALSADVNFGLYVPDIFFWHEPADLLRALHQRLATQGVDFICADVTAIDTSDPKHPLVKMRNGGERQAGNLVIAAGAYSKSLCADLNDNIPLDTERGYSTTLPQPGVDIGNLLLFVEDEFVATPMRSGLRLGGAVELAGLDAPPNFKRTSRLAEQIKTYFPDIDTADRWDMIGYRPSMPDGLPVISRARQSDSITYAFGHGHVGMTQSAITGKLVAQMIRGECTEIDMQPFSAARFH